MAAFRDFHRVTRASSIQLPSIMVTASPTAPAYPSRGANVRRWSRPGDQAVRRGLRPPIRLSRES
nr:hypothetical protein [Gordonia malaquae]